MHGNIAIIAIVLATGPFIFNVIGMVGATELTIGDIASLSDEQRFTYDEIKDQVSHIFLKDRLNLMS
jgi:hypothetical protein